MSECEHQSWEIADASVKGHGSLSTHVVKECQGCGGLKVEEREKIEDA